MEEVLKNAGLFLNILGMSRTSVIQQWDAEAFQKAFKWAIYFEQVYQKLNGKGKLREQLASFLKHQYGEADVVSGSCLLSFQDLQNASRVLRQNILQNIWCTSETYYNMLKTFYNVTERQPSAEILQHDVGVLIRLRYASASLQAAGQSLLENREKIMEKSNLKRKINNEASINQNNNLNERSVQEQFHTKVKSRMIRERVFNCLDKNSIGNLVQQMDHLTSTPNGDMILLGAYQLDLFENQLNKVNESIDDNKRKRFQGFVMKYVKDKIVPKWKSNTAHFLRLPVSKMVEIASVSDEFASLYISTLKSNCKSYDLKFGEEELLLRPRYGGQSDENEKEDWKKILKLHFQQLQLHKPLCDHIKRFVDLDDNKLEPNNLLTVSVWNEMTQHFIH